MQEGNRCSIKNFNVDHRDSVVGQSYRKDGQLCVKCTMWVVCFVYIMLFLFCRAAREEDAYSRMKEVVRWYLSGFYKKPKVGD